MLKLWIVINKVSLATAKEKSPWPLNVQITYKSHQNYTQSYVFESLSLQLYGTV